MPKLRGLSFPEWASTNERLIFPEWSFRDSGGLLGSAASNWDLIFWWHGNGARTGE